jgi:hypothetical protein
MRATSAFKERAEYHARVDHAWEARVAEAWAGIFAASSLPRGGTVVELGPGFSLKLGIALSRSGFSGRLVIVDPSARAGRRTAARYRGLLPRARVELAAIGVEALAIAGPIDALVANHVLDDLIVGLALPSRDRARLFDRFDDRAASIESVRACWSALVADPARLDAVKSGAVDVVRGAIARLEPRRVVLSQYRSWTLERHGLAMADAHAFEVLAALRAAERGCSWDQVIGRTGFDPGRWWVAA